MQCPYCRSKTEVLETRSAGAGVDLRRRRRCKVCGVTFATVEHATAEELQVTKRDGRVERFTRSKLLTSIENAAFVQPISAKETHAIVERVTMDLTEESRRVPDQAPTSARIGELVLKHLAASIEVQDGVRIRYAMVLNNKRGAQPQLRGSDDVLAWLEEAFPHLHPSRRMTMVVKRGTGEHEEFDLSTLVKSIKIVVDNGRSEAEALTLATEIAAKVQQRLKRQKLIMSQQIAVELLNILRDIDSIAYLRYASAVKWFRTPEDFYEEVIEQHRREEDAAAPPARRR